MKKTLTNIIDAKNHKIALGLGNFTIVSKLRKFLLEKIAEEKIHVIFGNEEEYRKLLKEPNLTGEEIVIHPLLKNVEDLIVTQGKQGIIGRSKAEIKKQKAFLISKSLIVNTIGAGDAVAGTYMAGLLKNISLEKRLRNAAKQAGKVIQIEDTRLPA